MQKLNYDQMIDEIAPIVFDKYFTLDKIGEILAFYKTLARRKLLKNTTLLMTDSMRSAMRSIAGKIPPVIRETQDEEKAEIRAHRLDHPAERQKKRR